jgi:hypothetical protein
MDFAVFGFGVEWSLARRFSLRLAPFLPAPKDRVLAPQHALRHADFLEVPVLLKASLAPRSAVQPYLLLGPSVGIRTAGRRAALLLLDAVLVRGSHRSVELSAAGFRSSDRGWDGFRARRGAAFAEAQWQIGLVDLDPRAGEDAEFRTRAFVVRAV